MAARSGTALGAMPIDMPIWPKIPMAGVKLGSPDRNGLVDKVNTDPAIIAGST